MKNIQKISKKQLYSGLLTILIILGFGITLTVLIRTIGASELRVIVEKSGVLGPLIFMIIHIITIMVTPGGGGVVLILSSGTLFGFGAGLFYSVLSAAIGASGNFWLSRKFGKNIVGRLVSEESFKKLDPIAKRVNSGNPLLLVPIFSTSAFNLSCYAIGLTNIKYNKFITAVLISSIVNAPIYVATGSSLIEGQTNWQYLILPIVVFLATTSYLIEERLKKRSKTR
jgi:uncharacterized membrane protein YdjX (TVP38/TMEM64 family)